MWNMRKFRTYAKQQQWIEANKGAYQIIVIYVNNGYAVEYRKLRIVY